MPSKQLNEIFHAGESPYFAMFSAGQQGYSLQDATNYASSLGIPIRQKDVRSWEDGRFEREMFLANKNRNGLNPFNAPTNTSMARRNMDQFPKWEDLSEFPEDWKGTDKRFFPCSEENRPLIKWGWSDSFCPKLLPYTDAKVLSPCKWVGQNMLYQPFIVLDIDGVGHGCVDEAVIQFGNLFKDKTLTYEDPAKLGSFHLYFKTRKLIPVKHFPWAKLDLMGNSVNAAVYFKNKQPNGLPMAELTPEIWRAIDTYQSKRKESACR